MLAILIYCALKRLNIISTNEKQLLRIKTTSQRILLILMLLVLTSSTAFNNPDKVIPKEFQIIRNNKVIGTIKVVKRVYNDSVIYNLQSKINVKLLLRFNIIGKERSVYNHGVLINSSVYRELNSKVKTDHIVRLQGNKYILKENDTTELLDIKTIEQNLITLYFQEPKGISSVFCDNQKEMIKVVNMGVGIYKVDISKGKYNIFYYEDGKCVKVEAVSSMFNVVLKPI